MHDQRAQVSMGYMGEELLNTKAQETVNLEVTFHVTPGENLKDNSTNLSPVGIKFL